MEISALTIRSFREKNSLTQEQLAKMLGVSYKTILNYEKGGVIPSTKIEILDILMSNYKKPSNVMEILDGENISKSQVSESQQPHLFGPRAIFSYIPEDLIKVPLLDINARAGFVENLDNYTEYLTEFTLVLPHQGERYDNALAMRVDGDSMEPQLQRGDVVLTFFQEKSEWEYLNPGVYAVVYRSSFVIKRIKKNTLQNLGILELLSDNEVHGPITVRHEDIRAIWKVKRMVERSIQ